MRRALLALAGLAAGTTVLISLRSAPGATRLPHEILNDALAAQSVPAPEGSAAPPDGAPPPASAQPASAPPPGPGATAGGPPPQATAAAPAPRTTTAPPPPPPGAAGTRITGDSVYTEFGYVTVAITVSGGRLVDVVAVELPSEHSRSVSINDRAAPILRQRALSAQSADIDTVSGATYTSDGYRESLQSALDQAGL